MNNYNIMTDKEIHDKEHNSLYDPKPGCEYCAKEVFRRTHKCFGDGMSTVPIDISRSNK